jgi:hypothetical protein
MAPPVWTTLTTRPFTHVVVRMLIALLDSEQYQYKKEKELNNEIATY